MESMVNFWKNKKVLITGHTGFKGSWLSLWLQHLQANVVGYALAPPTPINLFTEAKVSEGMIHIQGDVRNYEQLYQAINQHKPDLIFHLAAQSLVKYSYTHPVETYSTNVMGTVHLLEASRHCPSVRAVINVTTDKCYENKEINRGYRESESLGGHDPYSSSKGCSELVTGAYRNSYFNDLSSQRVGLASARAGNVIGGGDWAQDRLIPDLIATCMDGKELSIRYPNATRPWQHVLECLSGYLRLAELLYANPVQYSEAWNFGPHEVDVKSVAWIVEELLKLFSSPIKWQHQEVVNHEANFLQLDCSKAHAKLGWTNKWDIHKALGSTAEWYKQYSMGKDAREITFEQITKYIAEK